MLSNQKLFSVGNFDFRLQHLLVIGVLALSVSTSMLLRAGPFSYGTELFEFDPFFNYRATEYIVNNGPEEYFNWIDEKTWHPFGRNVSENSQVTLHLTAAILYQTFGFGLSLYNFTIIFPLVIGSITSIAVFAFVRVLGGTTAGLLAALIFSISVPIFTRGLVGWFKSEPLGLFFAFLALYLFVSAIKFNKGKISFIKLIFSAFFLTLGVSSWGGILFFVVVIALYYFAIPFIKNEKSFSIWAIPTMSISLILFSLVFERTSTLLIGNTGLNALTLVIILPTIFVFVCELVKKFTNKKTHIRNCIIFLVSIVVSVVTLIASGISIGLPTFRYLNAVNPFLTTQDPLTDSVAEHMTVQLSLSFSFLSVFLIFGIIGMWFVFTKKPFSLKDNMRIFIIISGILAIYVSSAFVRLELFASFAIIIFGSIGVSMLLRQMYENSGKIFLKIIFSSVIVILFITPVILPYEDSWTEWGNFPPSIMNGATSNAIATDDWTASMKWLKENSSEDSVIAAWWDYGYWITTLSDRTTLIDNATVSDFQIKKVAYALTAQPDKAWNILSSDYNTDISESLGDKNVINFEGTLESEFVEQYKKTHNGNDCKIVTKSESDRLGTDENWCNPVTKGLDADFVIIYVSGNRMLYQDNINIYTLEGGGDESKKHWMVKISGQTVSKFVESDGISPTPYFMEKTTLGKLIPFSIATYVEPNTDRTFNNYFHGVVPIYVKDLKFTNIDDPFNLVYASPSFYTNETGPFGTVLIYKINHDYNPLI